MKNNPTSKTNKGIIQGQPITPHTLAFYDLGKNMLVDSMVASRDYCKTMMGSCTGAIPIYLGILTFLLPENYRLGLGAGGLISLPAIGFLIATIIFSSGYLPLTGQISLDLVEKIEDEYNRIIKRRSRLISIGQYFFVSSTLGAILTITINLGVR